MDNAEQSPRPPSKGIFDTASLLGIPSPQTLCSKADLLNSIRGVSPKKIKSKEKDSTHAKNSDKSKVSPNSLAMQLSGSISGTKSSSKKSSLEPVNEQIARLLSNTEKPKRKPKPDSAKNGKSTKKQSKQAKEPKKSKKSSSESEGSCSTSSGTSGETSDEEEREKQQKQLAKLKRQQQELQRKVQKLKQASHDPKQEAHTKKVPGGSKNSLSPTGPLNHSFKPVPSPAHSLGSHITPPQLAPVDLKQPVNLSHTEEEPNAAFPLDLCMKKQEPTFEVTSSMVSNPFVPLTKKKPPSFASPMSLMSVPVLNKNSAPKKRGRKPKAVPLPPAAHSEKVRQTKRNSIKDISSLLMPQKMELLAAHAANASLLKSNLCPKVHAPNTLAMSGDILSSHHHKNFTLDCLLSETNGNPHLPEPPDSGVFHHSNKIFKHKERQRNNNNRVTSKKMDEKTLKEPIESPMHVESTSPSDTDPDEDNTDTDDTEHSPSESATDGTSTPSDRKRKHSYDEDGEDYRSKRRRTLPDTREVQIPLEHGWRRETRIRCFSRSGVRGEVSYYTPCGKKLRSYPEVVRYLIKNGITDISRDNFTFSTKVNVGEFLESTSSGSGQDYVLLSENEVALRIEEARLRKGRLGVQNRKVSSQKAEEEEQQRHWELQHHIDQQAKSREAYESKMLRQAQREQALIIARQEKRLRAEESRKQKEQMRLQKQQEKFERMEHMRIEREMRTQHILEDQEMKRQQAAFLREQEMQKRREMLLMVDLERERRRQHMILVRALETRKKQEVIFERERKREEILFEKRINREKKMEQRRMELDYLRELKKPVDDMMLKDLMPLPTLNRIPGVKLCGKAFADILMVFEFLHNFGETLGFDMDSLPTLNTLQAAVLNLDEKCEEEMLSVIHHLLVCVVDDPGVPHFPEAATVLGQNLKDADITNNNVSEVLRLFFIAQDKRSPMLEWLQAKPFLALNSSQKAEIIAYLCDELLSSRLLMRQVDSNIENVNVLRKDKWLVEGDLRRYRSIQQRRALKARLSAMEENKDNPNCANMLSADMPDFSLAKIDPPNGADDTKDKTDDIESELANESGNESDDTQAPGQISDNEDDDLHLSNDEINKKIEKLSKQLTQCSNKLTKAFYTIRGATFGMDRYHRRYWVLPKAGGVFVESMESSLKQEEWEKVISEAKEPSAKKEEDEDITSVEEAKETKVKEELSEVKTESIIDTEEKKEKTESETTDEAEKMDIEPPIEEKKDVEDIKMEDETSVVKTQVPDEEVVVKEEIKMEEEDTVLAEEKDTEQETKCEVKEELVVEEGEVIKDEKVIEKSETDLKPDLAPTDENLKELSSKELVDMVDKESTKIFAKESQLAIELSKKDKSKSDTKQVTDKISDISTKSSISDKKQGKVTETGHSSKKEREQKVKKEGKHKDNENKFLDKTMDVKDEKKHNVNIFMPNLCDTNINLDALSSTNKLHNNTSDRQQHSTPSPSIPPDQSWLFNSPLFASILAGNMLFNGPLMSQRDMNGTYFNLPKNDSNNPFGPFLGLQPGMLSAEQIFKSLGEKPSNQKPWFSILPRMPCDESLILSSPQGSNRNLHSPANMCSSNRMSHSPAPPGHVANALSNLQMELMNGVVPPGFFLHPFLPPQFGTTYQNTSPSSSAAPFSSPMPDFNFNRPPPTTTPNSIPTPSATPGPSQGGCATPTSRDSPSPCFAKRLLIEKMTQEYQHPLPIAIELQRGWWRITDPHQLKQVISALYHRGIREKMFQKQLQKHFTFACTSCSQGQSKETDFEITDLDQEISKCIGGAPDQDPSDFWYQDVALRVDMSILEQVENLEEKVDGSSMQVKGWKPPLKLSTEPTSKFIPSCEQYVHRTADEIYDAIKEKQLRKSIKKSSSRSKKKQQPKKEQESAEPIETDALEKDAGELDTTEKEPAEPMDTTTEDVEKNSSLLDDSLVKVESDIIPLPPGKLNPVEEAKQRLLKVEAAIERRYLRPPLGTRSQIQGGSCPVPSIPCSSDSGEEENLPVGLVKWRNAVYNCRTASQLAMCLNFLENCTAWDKSIMRASCQFCHSGDNEEKLLLCDGCDKGYHTYCFKPVMETIPEGDWYCFECLNKATGDNVCVICGTKGKLVECETCPKTFHLNCLDPPLAKMPKGKWYCSGCNLTRPKKSSKKSAAAKEKEAALKEAKELAATLAADKASSKKNEVTPVSTTPTSAKAKSAEKKKKANEERRKAAAAEKAAAAAAAAAEKEKEKEPTPEVEGNKDMGPCSEILEDMQKHEDAWPFLTPVNTKQFPTYRKVIKKPMDMATIKSRLDSGQYKCREDFAGDARLIFDNCETFNEDESPVGQAGHSMRAFFETRWGELT